jgi:hypothetical protein
VANEAAATCGAASGASCCGVAGAIYDIEAACWLGEERAPGDGPPVGPPVTEQLASCFAGMCIKTLNIGCYRMTRGGRQVEVVSTGGTIVMPLGSAQTGSDIRVCSQEERDGMGERTSAPRCPGQ